MLDEYSGADSPIVNGSSEDWWVLFRAEDDTYFIDEWQSEKKGDSVIVPSLVDGKPITSFGGDRFSVFDKDRYPEEGTLWENDIHRKITLSNGIKKIGMCAFQSCIALEKVIIPDSVVEIHAHAFRDCIALEYIVLPPKLTIIERDTFANCKSLLHVSFPSSLKIIKSGAFQDCNLQRINFHEGLLVIGPAAFVRNVSLKSVVLPRSVIKIGNHAFTCSQNGPIFYCYPGSYGYMWAKKQGFNVVSADAEDTRLGHKRTPESINHISEQKSVLVKPLAHKPIPSHSREVIREYLFSEPEDNDKEDLTDFYAEWSEEHMNPYGTQDCGDGYIDDNGAFHEY